MAFVATRCAVRPWSPFAKLPFGQRYMTEFSTHSGSPQTRIPSQTYYPAAILASSLSTSPSLYIPLLISPPHSTLPLAPCGHTTQPCRHNTQPRFSRLANRSPSPYSDRDPHQGPPGILVRRHWPSPHRCTLSLVGPQLQYQADI